LHLIIQLLGRANVPAGAELNGAIGVAGLP
jgi:hypothetical protein